VNGETVGRAKADVSSAIQDLARGDSSREWGGPRSDLRPERPRPPQSEVTQLWTNAASLGVKVWMAGAGSSAVRFLRPAIGQCLESRRLQDDVALFGEPFELERILVPGLKDHFSRSVQDLGDEKLLLPRFHVISVGVVPVVAMVYRLSRESRRWNVSHGSPPDGRGNNPPPGQSPCPVMRATGGHADGSLSTLQQLAPVPP